MANSLCVQKREGDDDQVGAPRRAALLGTTASAAGKTANLEALTSPLSRERITVAVVGVTRATFFFVVDVYVRSSIRPSVEDDVRLRRDVYLPTPTSSPPSSSSSLSMLPVQSSKINMFRLFSVMAD